MQASQIRSRNRAKHVLGLFAGNLQYWAVSINSCSHVWTSQLLATNTEALDSDSCAWMCSSLFILAKVHLAGQAATPHRGHHRVGNATSGLAKKTNRPHGQLDNKVVASDEAALYHSMVDCQKSRKEHIERSPAVCKHAALLSKDPRSSFYYMYAGER